MPDEFDKMFDNFIQAKTQSKSEGGSWWDWYDRLDQSWLPSRKDEEGKSNTGLGKIADKLKESGWSKTGSLVDNLDTLNYGLTDALVGSPIRAAGTIGTLATLPLSAGPSLAARIPSLAAGIRGLDAVNAARAGSRIYDSVQEGESPSVGDIAGAGLSALGAITPIKSRPRVQGKAAEELAGLTPVTSARIVPEWESEINRLLGSVSPQDKTIIEKILDGQQINNPRLNQIADEIRELKKLDTSQYNQPGLGLELSAEPHQNILQTITPTNRPGPARNYRQVISPPADQKLLPPRQFKSVPDKGRVAVDKPDIFGPGRRVKHPESADIENAIRFLSDNEYPVTEATIRQVLDGNFGVPRGVQLPGSASTPNPINTQAVPKPLDPSINNRGLGDMDVPKDQVLPLGPERFHKSPLDVWDAGTPLFPNEVGQHSKVAPQAFSELNVSPRNAGGTRNVLEAPVPGVEASKITSTQIREALAERGVADPSDELVAALRKNPERLRRMGLIRDEMVGVEAPPNQIKGLLPVAKREINPIRQAEEVTNWISDAKQVELPGLENKLDYMTVGVSNVDPEFGQIIQQAKEVSKAAPLSYAQELYRGLVMASGEELRRMGEGGSRIARVLDLIGTDTPRLYNNLASEWQEIKKGLDDKSFGKIVDFIEGETNSLPGNLQAKADQLKAFLARTGRLGEDVGIFKPRGENYFPHRWSADSKTLDEFRNTLRKQGRSEAEIQNILKGATEHDIGRIAAEYAREDIPMPGYRKDMGVIDEHIRDLSRRITEAQYLGVRGLEDVNSPISVMIRNAEDPNRASDIVNRILGRDYKAQGGNVGNISANVLQTIATASYLSNMRISNLGGTLPVIMQTSVKDTLKGFKDAITNSPDLKFMDNVNGYQAIARSIAEAYTHSKLVDKIHGITKAQNFMNKVAAGAAKAYAEEGLQALKANPNNSLLRKRLEDLTLEPAEVLLKQDSLTPGQLERVMVRGAEITQGVNEGRKLPHEWNRSGLVRIPQIFMRYNYQTTKMLKDAIKEDPLNNVPKLLIAGMAVGEVLGDSKEIVRTLGEVGTNQLFGEGDKELGDTLAHNLSTRRQQFTEKRVGAISNMLGGVLSRDDIDLNKVPGLTRAISNLENAFALGIPFDIINQFAESRGRMNPADTMVGLQEIGKIGQAGYNIATGNFRDVGRELATRIPFVGRGVASEIPTSRQLERESKKKKKGKYFKAFPD